jgi:hypothetical protein
MPSARPTHRTHAPLDRRRLIVTTFLAALAAALLNTVLYYLGSAFGAFPPDVIIQAGMPMTLAPIASLTLLATIAAGGVFWLLLRFTRHAQRNFLVGAGLVLLVMAIPPFTIGGAPAAMVAALQVTHLTTAAIATYALLRHAAPRSTTAPRVAREKQTPGARATGRPS